MELFKKKPPTDPNVEVELKVTPFFGMVRVPITQKIFFLDHLRVMIGAGLSVMEALRILGKELTNKNLKAVVQQVTKDVEAGTELSTALGKHPKVFSSMYVQMIAAGELAGKLEESLSQMVFQMKRSYQMASNIRSAMMYPTVIISAMVVVGILMATMVLPKLVVLFEEFDSELPLPTRVLIAVSHVMGNPFYLALIIIGTVGFVALHISTMKRSENYKRHTHSFMLHLPIFGPVIKQINLARFSLTLSSLLKSTIPIIDATKITADTCGNMLYSEALTRASEDMKQGQPLSDVLHRYPFLFPPMVTEMVLVGERTGEVEQLLQELAEFFSTEVDHTMKNFTIIIEPVIIVLLGLAVAGIAVAVIMPMYSLVQQF